MYNLYHIPDYDVELAYIIDNTVYNPRDLESLAFDEEEIEEILTREPIRFNIDPNGSKPIAVEFINNGFITIAIYQEINNNIVQLTPEAGRYNEVGSVEILKVPLPGAEPINDNLPELNLRDPSEEFIIELRDYIISHASRSPSLSPLRSAPQSPQRSPPWLPPLSPQSPQASPQRSSFQSVDLSQYELLKLSHEALVNQLYGLEVQLPEYLIINGLRVNFIPFEQLSLISFQRWIIDPMIQPWAGQPRTPNRILTIFDTHGTTYLVKVRFDPLTNQIFLPI